MARNIQKFSHAALGGFVLFLNEPSFKLVPVDKDKYIFAITFSEKQLENKLKKQIAPELLSKLPGFIKDLKEGSSKILSPDDPLSIQNYLFKKAKNKDDNLKIMENIISFSDEFSTDNKNEPLISNDQGTKQKYTRKQQSADKINSLFVKRYKEYILKYPSKADKGKFPNVDKQFLVDFRMYRDNIRFSKTRGFSMSKKESVNVDSEVIDTESLSLVERMKIYIEEGRQHPSPTTLYNFVFNKETLTLKQQKDFLEHHDSCTRCQKSLLSLKNTCNG